MRITVLLLIGLGAGGSFACQADEACLTSSATRIGEYRSASPLLPISPKNTLRVTVLDDGCVLTHQPAYFVDPGLAAERISAEALTRFRSQLAESNPAGFDADAVKSRHRAAIQSDQPGRIIRITTDENIIEFDLFPATPSEALGAVKHIRWGSLHGDLLNHPDDQDLVRLAAAEQLFRAFIERRNAKRETIR